MEYTCSPEGKTYLFGFLNEIYNGGKIDVYKHFSKEKFLKENLDDYEELAALIIAYNLEKDNIQVSDEIAEMYDEEFNNINMNLAVFRLYAEGKLSIKYDIDKKDYMIQQTESGLQQGKDLLKTKPESRQYLYRVFVKEIINKPTSLRLAKIKEFTAKVSTDLGMDYDTILKEINDTLDQIIKELK